MVLFCKARNFQEQRRRQVYGYGNHVTLRRFPEGGSRHKQRLENLKYPTNNVQAQILMVLSLLITDPYVKVYLLCEGKRIKKKKTTVKKATLSPVYNEALVFDVPAENIEDVSLIVKVIDYDRYGT